MRKIDYTTMNSKAPAEGSFDKRWWLLDEKERPQTIVKIVKYLSENDSARQLQYQTNAKLYGNISLLGISGYGGAKTQAQSAIKDRVTYNVIQSAIDTITAKMAKNKPKSSFITEGGDWQLQRKAKKLEKFCDGVRYENQGHFMGVNAFRDGCVFGDGLVHVFANHGRVKWERCLASELFVDAVDSFYGNPRCKYRVKNLDRDVLIDLFPDKKDAILEAPAAKADLTGTYQNVSDQVTVAEAWHLPSGPGAKDGLHLIVLENVELTSDKWTRPYYPFAKLPWSPRLEGYWSQGVPEQLQGNQLEINKISWLIQRSMHLAGTFKVWLKNGSKIVKEHINNDIGAIINSDEMPQYLLPPIVQPEVYQRLQALKQDSFELVGVSMLSAASKKPEGLDSGKALREFNDIESDRFMINGQVYEKFFLDLDRLSIDCAKEIYKETGTFEAKVPGKKFLETISWKDVEMDDDEYLMKAYPTSSLPNEPAGRLQTVQEYVQAGFYTPRTAKRLLDMPDLEQIDDLSDAQENWIHSVLEEIVEDNEYSPPEPEMDLKLAKELVLEYIAQAHTNGLEEAKIENLRLFNTQIDTLTQKAMPPLPPMGMPGDASGAQAVPEAAPVSPMIPNAPVGAA
jgi:hypothetical protein